MSVSEQMKIIDAPQPGGPEALVYLNREVPSPAANEVLIKVAAAGLNRADILQRRGKYPAPPGAPTYPGLEVAGTIVATGEAISEYKIGDRVCALLAGGGYAEYCVVDAGQVLPIPGALSMIEAAALPEAYFTAYSNLYEFGRLKRGESLLVHGGSSGVGVAAIQLASSLGSTVFATAGSEEKCRLCESLGASRAIDYKQADFVTEIQSLTQNRGVDVVLDMVGGAYLARNVQVLTTEGRLVCIATQSGPKGELDILRVMQRRLSITGSTLRGRSVEFKRTIRDLLVTHIWPLIASGAIKPIVDRVFPFTDAAAAHAYMESGTHKGKIILAVE